MSDLRLNGSSGVARQDAGDDDVPRVLVIDIDPPIEFSNGKTYDTLRLEEPTGQAVQKAEQELKDGANWASLRAYQFALISNATGVPRGVIERMRISQIIQAADFLQTFLPGGRLIGEN